MLGKYPKNLDILTGYHFWNPLDIKNFDIHNDVIISGCQNNDIQSYNIWTEYIYFENMISKVDIKSMPEYGYERDLGLRCRLLGRSKQNYGC